ncbi:MAG: hypothetical protein KJ047_01375 [Anaerolineae bacterium]|nr:hypothetical protein [Anaerolineae bacterium]MEB2288158.1 hypothetical protein [Anaerolineae bacterium]
MGRVVNANNPTSVRNQHMRTAAELLRLLSQKADLDADARNMAAQVVFCLRAIGEGIDSSAAAWEKRDYWVKAEQLRQRWGWASEYAGRLETIIRREQWDRLPLLLVELFPHFAEIKVTRLTREADTWAGAYQRLLDE